jgi:hypothetical protein
MQKTSSLRGYRQLKNDLNPENDPAAVGPTPPQDLFKLAG